MSSELAAALENWRKDAEGDIWRSYTKAITADKREAQHKLVALFMGASTTGTETRIWLIAAFRYQTYYFTNTLEVLTDWK